MKITFYFVRFAFFIYKEFDYLENEVRPSCIRILINSEGGSVLYGMLIYSTIHNFKIDTECIIESIVSQAASEWQNRPLESLYMIVWMDGIVFKVRENGKVINKTVYLYVGLNKEGLKEVLGMWVGKNASAAFWMGVLTDLKARSVEDILITVTDNLNGFTETIKNVFPSSTTQICVVHQIRNSCRYVVWKEKKEFTSDLKNIYNAPTKEAVEMELDNFEQNGRQIFICNTFMEK